MNLPELNQVNGKSVRFDTDRNGTAEVEEEDETHFRDEETLTPQWTTRESGWSNGAVSQELDDFKQLLHEVSSESPAVAVSFDDVTCSYTRQQKQDRPSLCGSFVSRIQRLAERISGSKTTEEHEIGYALREATGMVRAGSMTLVLAPQGHGKTSLLRALTKMIPSSELQGNVTYSTAKERAHGLDGKIPESTGCYMGQVDVHIGKLTVEETVQFACNCVMSSEFVPRAAEVLLRLLHLEECAKTRVRSPLGADGISGGQRKRLSIAETLLTSARVVALDEVISGLDSATALIVVRAIRLFCKETNRTIIFSLVEPNQEIARLFDDLLVLSKGRVVYNGTTDAVPQFLGFLGYTVEKEEAIRTLVAMAGRQDNQHLGKLGEANDENSHSRFLQSKWQEFSSQSADLNQTSITLSEKNTDTNLQHIKLQWGHCVWVCLCRKIKTLLRELRFIWNRLFQSILFGSVLGAIYWQLGETDFRLKFGVFSFCIMFLSLANEGDVPIDAHHHRVASKHIAAGLYSSSDYIIAIMLAQTPLAATQVVLLGTPFYWMVGLSPEIGTYLFFLLAFLVHSLAMSAFARLVSHAKRDVSLSQAQGGLLMMIALLFGGFLITRKNIPMVIRWLYYLSPMSWTTTSLMQNELRSIESLRGNSSVAMGKLGLEAFEIPTPAWYQWGGVAIVFGYCLLFVYSTILVIRRNYGGITIGSHVDLSDRGSLSHLSRRHLTAQLYFVPQTLIFRDISYSVRENGAQRTLISGVSGICRPGTLTVVLGASGSGKTTFLEVLAKRKIEGQVRGEIAIANDLNGTDMKINMGYVEQFDICMPFSTTLENLVHSARLRLSDSKESHSVETLVQATLDILGLTHVKDVLAGDANFPSAYRTLSLAERRKLSLGMELVANPSILIVDEPTTGLDFEGSMSVMESIANIKRTGRTIICSIHQPINELFSFFDEAIVLQSGGKQIYCGPLGENGRFIFDYFKAIGVNPRKCGDIESSIQDIISVNNRTNSRPGEKCVDLAQQYVMSSSKVELDQVLGQELKETSVESYKALKVNQNFPPLTLQLKMLLKRSMVLYWRNVDYTGSTLVMCVLTGLIMGLLYYNSRNKMDDEASFLSLTSFILISQGIGGVLKYQMVVPFLCAQQHVREKEFYNRMCSTFAYLSALFLVETLNIALLTILFSCSYYFLVGFDTTVGTFFHCLLVTFLLYWEMTSFGILLAVIFGNVVVAQSVGGLFLPIKFLFAGTFINLSAIPQGLQWIYWINPVAYVVNVIASLQLHCEDTPGKSCPMMQHVADGGEPSEIRQYDFAERVFGFDYDRRWELTAYLFIFTFMFVFLTALCLRYKKR